MKINDLITELQAFADQHGNMDVIFNVHSDNTDQYGEEAKAMINSSGNNITATGCFDANINLLLESGCKITTSKELKEKRKSGDHIWTGNKWHLEVGGDINDSSFERRTKRFGSPRNKWSTMTEDNC